MTVTPTPMTGELGVEGGDLVLSVLGQVDAATLEQFQAITAEVVAVGARRVIIDLARGEFLDASGPTALLLAAEGIRRSGGELLIRGAKAPYRDLFAEAGMIPAHGVKRLPASAGLMAGLVGYSQVPPAREVLDAALSLVVTMAQAVVGGADGVSITLPRNGMFGTVAASNDVVLDMDHDQYYTGQGPCLDAATHGRPVHTDALADEARWPEFVPRARARGIGTILSAPLLNADRPIGALNIYSRTNGAFASHEKQWAEQFAAEASTVVSVAEPESPVDVLTQQIQQALQSREVITLAQGIVMHRDKVSAKVAHAGLVSASRRSGRPLRDICEDIVDPLEGAHVSRVPADGSADGSPTR